MYIHPKTNQLTAAPGTKVTISDRPELARLKPAIISSAITEPIASSQS
ncbi:hypothetical protein [Mycobacterium sp. 1245852.3]|nr:hypothetical protein [Mycobacterium sp. 1245852.3]